uniref:E3 ubiquitin-protein ligase TRIM21-like n=1 Tax=Sander lucioperca TaxID=283035 RepID=A0A8C9Z006_SANLU
MQSSAGIEFLCSICLDVFTDPVAISCGHSFCKNCITEHWNTNDQYLCPMCKKVFNTKPELHVNTFISEMVAQFRQSAQQKASSSSSEQQVMCTEHDKPLELFCKTDQTCVCMLCSILDHKMHDVVPLKEGYEGKKAELGKTGAEIQQMIQKRRLKIQEIKHSVDLSEEDADREIAEGVQVFTSLKESVEREKQAEAFIKELEQEISELMKRSTEVEQDWTQVSVRPSSYEGTVVKAVVQLEETLSKEMKMWLAESELKRVQQYAVDVTLDPDTAHPKLILSDDGKQVNLGDVSKNLQDNQKRFSECASVLGKQSFSSSRFYFEVQVKGKTEWTLGVARESINRKKAVPLSPQNGYWTIVLRNGYEYKAGADPPVLLSLKSPPQKVGVFGDYEEGLVSFYDVDAAALIYSFTGCSFTEKLFSFFNPSDNDDSVPLIISPVSRACSSPLVALDEFEFCD